MASMAGSKLQRHGVPKTREQLIDRLSSQSTSPPQAPQPTSPNKYVDVGSSVHASTLLLPTSFVSRLRDTARQKGTTVHGALCAAAALAGRTVYDNDAWRKGMIRIDSPLSVRDTLNAGDICVPLLTPGKASCDITDSVQFWDTAQSLRNQNLACITDEQLRAGGAGLTQFFSSNPDVDTVAAMASVAFGTDVIMTNIGVWPYPTQFGDLRVEVVHGPALSMGFGDIETVGVASSPGGLSLTHVSFKSIPGLLEGMAKELREACETSLAS